jgi:glycosyltransferase involved in cell wall biosynthesis
MEYNNKPLTLSIVIPAYNEERYIKKCLDSIKKQTIMPDEVILVDNNCTDRTIDIASKYDFVHIVTESKQGMASARNKGFSMAHSDIIGRIDVDAQLTPTWVEVVLKTFRDPSVAAITGPGITSTTPIIRGRQIFPSLRTAIWSKLYLLISSSVMRLTVLWGANMAIRSSTWDLVKESVCSDDRLVHEDQDISILIAGKGLKSLVVPGLDIRTDGTTYFFWPKFKEYFLRSFKTIDYHKKLGTLDNPEAIRLSLARSVLVIILSLIPAIFFIVTSFLFFYIPEQFLKIDRLFKRTKDS